MIKFLAKGSNKLNTIYKTWFEVYNNVVCADLSSYSNIKGYHYYYNPYESHFYLDVPTIIIYWKY